MGNCCLKGSRSSTMVWADEDEEWVYYSDPNLKHKQSLLSNKRTGDNRSNPSVSLNKIREVKVMLSKKKLEELLGKMGNVHNIPVDQILDQLIDSSNRFELTYDHHEPWKPNLDSIPEEN